MFVLYIFQRFGSMKHQPLGCYSLDIVQQVTTMET